LLLACGFCKSSMKEILWIEWQFGKKH